MPGLEGGDGAIGLGAVVAADRQARARGVQQLLRPHDLIAVGARVHRRREERLSRELQRRRGERDELFRQIIAWGGAITGEHGIGLAKLPWWPKAAPAELRRLHARIKGAVDPNGILNPGKFI